jgi:hypothetical protein
LIKCDGPQFADKVKATLRFSSHFGISINGINGECVSAHTALEDNVLAVANDKHPSNACAMPFLALCLCSKSGRSRPPACDASASPRWLCKGSRSIARPCSARPVSQRAIVSLPRDSMCYHYERRCSRRTPTIGTAAESWGQPTQRSTWTFRNIWWNQLCVATHVA